jgi:hypothetical protein
VAGWPVGVAHNRDRPAPKLKASGFLCASTDIADIGKGLAETLIGADFPWRTMLIVNGSERFC